MHTGTIGQDASPGVGDCGASTFLYLTLSQAAQLLPGRPSACAVWRWGRKGIKARGGERVKLQHIRLGGRVYTRSDWLEEFGKRLAEADVAHFDARAETPLPPRDPAYGPPTGRRGRHKPKPAAIHQSRNAEIERALEEEGL